MRGQDRLHGELVLVPPLSWQIIGAFLLATVLVAGLFLSLAQYGKVTTVEGRLTGSRGIVRAVALRSGRVEAVLVEEGHRVAAGAPIARISGATSDGGALLEDRRAAAIARQDELLRLRAPEIALAFQARANGLRAQIDGDRREIASIAAQIDEQRNLVGA